MAAIDTIPNAFWSALNNQNLTDLLPPRWSILVNDAGVQVLSGPISGLFEYSMAIIVSQESLISVG